MKPENLAVLIRTTCKGLEFFLGFLSIVFCLGESVFYKMNVMLQFSGALTLRQQLDWKKQKKEQQKAFEMSCDTEYLKKTAFDFFGNVVSVVLYCVQ